MTLVIAEPVAEPVEIGLPETIEVVVTLEDIQQGVQGVPESCAAALALGRMGFSDVQVQHGIVFIWKTQSLSGFADPDVFGAGDDFADWVFAFDRDKSSVAPERFIFHRKH